MNAATRAKIDAVRDMLREDAITPAEAAGLLGGEPEYYAAYSVGNRRTGEVELGIQRVRARSHAEAVGMAYKELEADYPSEEGWRAPAIAVDPAFALAIDDLGLRLAVA